MSGPHYMFKIVNGYVACGQVTSSNNWCELNCPTNELWVEGFMGGTPRRYPGLNWQYLDYIGNGFGEFIRQSPYPSWIVDDETVKWIAPVDYPDDQGNVYNWNENIINWEKVDGNIFL